MVRDIGLSEMLRSDVAQRINEFSASELLNFIKEQLDAKSLHNVVQELNALVLAKQESAPAAQQALARIGFTD